MTDFDPRLVSAARQLTDELRTSPKPRWATLRERLGIEGSDAADAAVGVVYPADVKLDMGLIATRDGRFFSFELEWWYDEEGNDVTSRDEAWLSEWQEVRMEDLDANDAELAAIARLVLAPEAEG